MKNNLNNNAKDLQQNQSIDWSTIQSDMKKSFGSEIFESWLRKIDLIEEFNNYILISVPTRFIRDWIASRYLDQVLQNVRNYKKQILRIEISINVAILLFFISLLL